MTVYTSVSVDKQLVDEYTSYFDDISDFTTCT